MLQPMLTVIEVALVLAALYVYWMTRKLLGEAKEQSKASPADVEIVRDVSELLTELQSATWPVNRKTWSIGQSMITLPSVFIGHPSMRLSLCGPLNQLAWSARCMFCMLSVTNRSMPGE